MHGQGGWVLWKMLTTRALGVRLSTLSAKIHSFQRMDLGAAAGASMGPAAQQQQQQQQQLHILLHRRVPLQLMTAPLQGAVGVQLQATVLKGLLLIPALCTRIAAAVPTCRCP
jgi:hypothetical protein